MRTTLCTLLMFAFAAAAQAEVPPGPDAVNGAFARLLEHEPVTSLAPVASVGDENDSYVEHWVNAIARQEMSSPEAGFVHMLARRDEDPTALLASGEPDPVALMISAALQAQRPAHQRLALQLR